jgi:hypothetical protein
LAACAQVCEHDIDAVLVNQAKAGVGNAKTHPTVFGLDPEAAVMQVWQEPAFGFVVGVGNIVPDHWAFARDFTYACHVDTPQKMALTFFVNTPTFPAELIPPHLALTEAVTG